jgi:hypothetical protein
METRMTKNNVRRQPVLHNFRFWMTLGFLVSMPFFEAFGQAPAPQSTATHQPTKQERETWRKSMARTPRPKKGCFEASYPETKWREVPCKKAPQKPYPKKGVRPDTVGNGTDFSAQVTGHISSAEGSFDSVTGVTSESVSSGGIGPFSLQLNTNFFLHLHLQHGRDSRQLPGLGAVHLLGYWLAIHSVLADQLCESVPVRLEYIRQ